MLGFIMVRTRSVFACILFHAVYNGILALTLHVGWLGWKLEGMGAPAFTLAVVGLVACVVFFLRQKKWYAREDSNPQPPGP